MLIEIITGSHGYYQRLEKAEVKLVNSEEYNHEYLSISGYQPFLTESAKVILGNNSAAIKESRVTSQQSLSGTGSFTLGWSLFEGIFHH